MPVITLNVERFCSHLGREFSASELADLLPWLGLDIEEVGADYVKVEYTPNRLDFSSHAGIARALKGLLEIDVGLPHYSVDEPQYALTVDPLVAEVRPYVLAAVVRELKLTGEDVREIMEVQEDLHWGVGRNRRKVSIGVHDLDAVAPPFSYVTGDPDAVAFVPLDSDAEMSLREIIEKHEKGRLYGYIVARARRYPLIVDSKGRVMSFPPVINAELTRVTSKTTDFFIDVTGTDFKAVAQALNILITTFHDMGGRVEAIKVQYPDREVVSPDLTPKRLSVRASYIRRYIGLDLSEEEVRRSLERSRLGVEKVERGVFHVLIPAYRIDIMHEIDLVEEALIGYGTYRVTPTMPRTVTIGKSHEVQEVADLIRQVMIGLGFIEAMNFLLIREDIHYRKMRLKEGRAVRLANPVSSEYSMLREWLLPSLMKNLADNRHESYPQKLFEVADVVKVDERLEVKSRRELHAAGVVSHSSANFTEIKSCVEALLNNLGADEWRIRGGRHPSFVPGRTGAIYVKGTKVGVLGEIHPEVLNGFELENPTCAFEINVDLLKRRLPSRVA